MLYQFFLKYFTKKTLKYRINLLNNIPTVKQNLTKKKKNEMKMKTKINHQRILCKKIYEYTINHIDIFKIK